jgi:hypothetical protein
MLSFGSCDGLAEASLGRSFAALKVAQQRTAGKKLGWNLRQYFHPADLGGDPEALAGPLFHAQHTGVATNPALLSGGQLGRENQDQLDIRALHHARLGIEEYAIGADVAGLGAQLRVCRSGPNPYRQSGNNSFAGTSIDLRVHES